MCLDQGRSVGVSARGDAYTATAQPRRFPPSCVWVNEELRTNGHALRLQRLTYRKRQPVLGSPRSERRDPQSFLPRPRCLLWVISGCAGPAAAWQVNPNKRTPAHETERTYLAIRHPRADDNVLDLLI
jgi:hypothetical protein